MSHEYDDDGACIHCGFDGAEHHWWKTSTYEGRATSDEKRKEPPCSVTDQKIRERNKRCAEH